MIGVRRMSDQPQKGNAKKLLEDIEDVLLGHQPTPTGISDDLLLNLHKTLVDFGNLMENLSNEELEVLSKLLGKVTNEKNRRELKRLLDQKCECGWYKPICERCLKLQYGWGFNNKCS